MNAEGSSGNRRSWLDRISQALGREPASRTELVELLRAAEQRNILDAEVLSIIEGALTVSDMQAREIMIPRSQMKVVRLDMRPEEILPFVIDSGHSRFPVLADNPDDVLGILFRAKIHDGLRVVTDTLRWRAFVRQLPERRADSRFSRPAADRRVSCKYTLHIAIQNGMALSECDRQYCAGSRSPDAWQRQNGVDRCRKLAVVIVANYLGCAMQVARARIVTEAGPVIQHVVNARVGEIADPGETLHEPLEVRNHGLHLRLLQHDFRYPNTVGTDLLLPGQILAAMRIEPAQQSRGKVSHPVLVSAARCAQFD